MKRKRTALSIIVFLLFGIVASIAGLGDANSLFEDLGMDQLVAELWQTPTPSLTQVSNDQKDLYLVVRIVDGDTIKVLIAGKEETVRLVNMNAPESVDPRRPVGCMGAEASQQLTSLLTGKQVRLQVDTSQADRDRYDRLLRYVFLPDGADVGLAMIRLGFAQSTPYGSTPHQYYDIYQAAQAEAQQQQMGLWDPTACNSE